MIEVERKFSLDAKQLELIKANGEFIEKKTIQDVYYDDAKYNLSIKNIWLRKRNSHFELKIGITKKRERVDLYEEITSEPKIKQYLSLGKGLIEEGLTKKKIFPFCSIATDRLKYKINKFIIDIDEAKIEDFTYNVAEIELHVKNEEEIPNAKEEILIFSKTLGIDSNKIVSGKLIAFLAHKRKEHYYALLDAGVISSL